MESFGGRTSTATSDSAEEWGRHSPRKQTAFWSHCRLDEHGCTSTRGFRSEHAQSAKSRAARFIGTPSPTGTRWGTWAGSRPAAR